MFLVPVLGFWEENASIIVQILTNTSKSLANSKVISYLRLLKNEKDSSKRFHGVSGSGFKFCSLTFGL